MAAISSRSIALAGCVTSAWIGLGVYVINEDPAGARGTITGLLVVLTLGVLAAGCRHQIMAALKEAHGLHVPTPRRDGALDGVPANVRAALSEIERRWADASRRP